MSCKPILSLTLALVSAIARNRASYLGYTVDLMNSLGGGWTPY